MFINWWDNPMNPDAWHKHQVRCRSITLRRARSPPWRRRGRANRADDPLVFPPLNTLPQINKHTARLVRRRLLGRGLRRRLWRRQEEGARAGGGGKGMSAKRYRPSNTRTLCSRAPACFACARARANTRVSLIPKRTHLFPLRKILLCCKDRLAFFELSSFFLESERAAELERERLLPRRRRRSRRRHRRSSLPLLLAPSPAPFLRLFPKTPLSAHVFSPKEQRWCVFATATTRRRRAAKKNNSAGRAREGAAPARDHSRAHSSPPARRAPQLARKGPSPS
jgi:hypothetical protein